MKYSHSKTNILYDTKELAEQAAKDYVINTRQSIAYDFIKSHIQHEWDENNNCNVAYAEKPTPLNVNALQNNLIVELPTIIKFEQVK